MGRKNREKSRLDTSLNLRLTMQEKQQLKEDAYLVSLTMSQLVRRKYFGRRITQNSKIQILKELRRIAEYLSQRDKPMIDLGDLQTQKVMRDLVELMDKLGRDC